MYYGGMQFANSLNKTRHGDLPFNSKYNYGCFSYFEIFL